MSSSNAFTPFGNTVAFIASTAAPTPVQASTVGGSGNQYLIQNAGTATVFLGVGSTAALANAAAATVTSTGPSIPILPSTVQVLTFNTQAYFTGVASANSTVYITPGDGI
jgi:hypothetical protein